MTAADLVRAGELVGVGESTARVALTRAVQSGDLVRADGRYELGPRLVARQRRQDRAVEHAADHWDGTWSQLVVRGPGRSAVHRAALRSAMVAARFAELREGVWMRPDNLPATHVADEAVVAFTIAAVDEPGQFARELWDLDGWAERGESLLEELGSTIEPSLRLGVAADVVRHLVHDPLLPAQVLPNTWPGDRLRAAYADYQGQLLALLTD